MNELIYHREIFEKLLSIDKQSSLSQIKISIGKTIDILFCYNKHCDFLVSWILIGNYLKKWEINNGWEKIWIPPKVLIHLALLRFLFVCLLSYFNFYIEGVSPLTRE